jgi:class 3 adenylate cyclase
MIAGQGSISKAGVQIVPNVQSRHERYEVMTVQEERTILFVDVVGST